MKIVKHGANWVSLSGVKFVKIKDQNNQSNKRQH